MWAAPRPQLGQDKPVATRSPYKGTCPWHRGVTHVRLALSPGHLPKVAPGCPDTQGSVVATREGGDTARGAQPMAHLGRRGARWLPGDTALCDSRHTAAAQLVGHPLGHAGWWPCWHTAPRGHRCPLSPAATSLGTALCPTTTTATQQQRGSLQPHPTPCPCRASPRPGDKAVAGDRQQGTGPAEAPCGMGTPPPVPWSPRTPGLPPEPLPQATPCTQRDDQPGVPPPRPARTPGTRHSPWPGRAGPRRAGRSAHGCGRALPALSAPGAGGRLLKPGGGAKP